MTSRATLDLAHHHPGRLRVRSDALRRTDHAPVTDRLERVRGVVAAMHGVRSIRFNMESGSVLIEYEPGAVDPNVLIDAVASAADLEPPPPEQERRAGPRPASILIRTARTINALTDELTGGRADLRDLVPMAMTGVAAYSFIVGKDRLPRWDNLAYWAFSIFQSLHATEIAESEGRAQ